jgi:LmbE family N-acetylglucosaminyl deacetylase
VTSACVVAHGVLSWRPGESWLLLPEAYGRIVEGAGVPLADGDAWRVLVIVAHPDDAEFWMGGTIALWAGAGAIITYCVLTDGDGGGFDPGLARERVPEIRREEQRRAAAVLGVRDVTFLGLREQRLSNADWDLHEALVRVIRRVRPQRLLTWSPEWNWQRFRSCHPDHLATGTAVLTALYPDAGNRFALTHLLGEGLEPWTVPEIWLINSPQREINQYVDITETFDRKVAAVRAHVSQIKEPNGLADRLRQRIVANTAAAGLPEGRLAEAFQVVATG